MFFRSYESRKWTLKLYAYAPSAKTQRTCFINELLNQQVQKHSHTAGSKNTTKCIMVLPIVMFKLYTHSTSSPTPKNLACSNESVIDLHNRNSTNAKNKIRLKDKKRYMRENQLTYLWPMLELYEWEDYVKPKLPNKLKRSIKNNKWQILSIYYS